MTDTRILSPERIEEIRATLAKRLGDARRQAKKEHTRPYQVVLSMRDGDDVVTALAHVTALSEQVERLTAEITKCTWKEIPPSLNVAFMAVSQMAVAHEERASEELRDIRMADVIQLIGDLHSRAAFLWRLQSLATTPRTE